MIAKICGVCKTKYLIKEYRENTSFFCSRKCLADSKKLPQIKCKHCGKEFKPRLKVIQFCSIRCSTLSFNANLRNKNIKHPSWRGGIYRRKGNNYVEIWNGKRYIGQHRKVMEEILGRKLLSHEFVHHINGIKNDNRPENLVVLSKTDHNKIHKTEEVKNRLRNSSGKFV